MPEVLKYRPFLCTLPAFLRFKPYTADPFLGLTDACIDFFKLLPHFTRSTKQLFKSPILHCVYVDTGFHCSSKLDMVPFTTLGGQTSMELWDVYVSQ